VLCARKPSEQRLLLAARPIERPAGKSKGCLEGMGRVFLGESGDRIPGD
jgi:hypothetical protein